MATAFTQAALDAASREEDAAIAKKQELLRARRVTENYIYDGRRSLAQIQSRIAAVSYTHLTLPTSDLV